MNLFSGGFKRQNADKNVDFTFFTGVTSDIMHKLQRHELDIVFSSKAPEEYKFESIPIKKQDLVLIVPPEHRLAARHTAELFDKLRMKYSSKFPPRNMFYPPHQNTSSDEEWFDY